MNLYAVSYICLGLYEEEDLNLSIQRANTPADAILLAIEGSKVPKELSYLRNNVEEMIDYYAENNVLVKYVLIES